MSAGGFWENRRFRVPSTVVRVAGNGISSSFPVIFRSDAARCLADFGDSGDASSSWQSVYQTDAAELSRRIPTD
jgi:hypothetical protein